MKKNRANNDESMSFEVLRLLGNAAFTYTDKAFETDDKEKFMRLSSKNEKQKRYTRYYALAASVSLVICASLFFTLLSGSFNEGESIPETIKKFPSYDKNISESFDPIEGRVVITSGDMWNYYAARKALCDFASPSLSKNAFLLVNNSGIGAHTAFLEEDEESVLTPESGYGVTDGEVSSAAVPNNDAVYYDLKEFGELRITGATYFKAEIKEKNGILASKIGVGIVEVVITRITDFDSMITFKNGDRFYSCLENGLNEFSTHKYIDGFFVVKNEGNDTGSYTIEYDKQGNAVSMKCRIVNSKKFLPDDIDVILGTTVSVNVDESYSIEELEDFFNSKEA